LVGVDVVGAGKGADVRRGDRWAELLLPPHLLVGGALGGVREGGGARSVGAVGGVVFWRFELIFVDGVV
jgi:hypothetical protein